MTKPRLIKRNGNEAKAREIASLADLLPDDRNANKGTERGEGMLEDSLRQYGLGRGVLIDRNGKLIAGNKTVQKAVELGFEKFVVVPSDGKTLVITQREDLDLDTDRQARELAIADNRVGQINLEFDADVLAGLQEEADLSRFWSDDEFSALLEEQKTCIDWSGALGKLPSGDKPPFQQMTFTLSDSQAEMVQTALEKAKRAGPFVDSGNENSNGNALERICANYVG